MILYIPICINVPNILEIKIETYTQIILSINIERKDELQIL